MEQRPKTILIVDDQADEREIQRAMLSHLGYEVLTAADGASGLECALAAAPDLVLLDVAMPRLDGLTVCRALRDDRRTAAVPVVLYTASVVGDLQAQAAEAGASDVLGKPLDPRQVAATIERLIGPAR